MTVPLTLMAVVVFWRMLYKRYYRLFNIISLLVLPESRQWVSSRGHFRNSYHSQSSSSCLYLSSCLELLLLVSSGYPHLSDSYQLLRVYIAFSIQCKLRNMYMPVMVMLWLSWPGLAGHDMCLTGSGNCQVEMC